MSIRLSPLVFSADGGEIGGEQFAQTGSGRSSEIAAPFEPEPARFCQVRRFTVILEFFDFVASSLVDRRVELLNDVKTVEDVEGVGRSFGDDVEVRFPHIRADKLYRFRSFIAKHVKELMKGFFGAIRANPEQRR